MALGLFFGIYLQFTNREIEKFKNLPLIFSLILLLPILSFLIYMVKKGEFDDFDVSNQLKRNKLYRFVIFCFLILNIFLFLGNYPTKAQIIGLTFILLLFLSYQMNKKIKVSLHTNFNFLFVYLFFPLNIYISTVLFLFGFFNMWSRLVLNRHKLNEVVYGFILGNSVGISYLLLFNYLKLSA